jgi:hypothetical protein
MSGGRLSAGAGNGGPAIGGVGPERRHGQRGERVWRGRRNVQR